MTNNSRERDKNLVYGAETARLAGHLVDALYLAQKASEMPVEEVATLDEGDLQLAMMNWRIWVTTLHARSSQTPLGNRGAEYLKQSGQVIHRFYDHDRVVSTAHEMKVNPKGAEYPMAAEMHGDRGNRFRRIAELTGYTKFFDFAIAQFNQGSRIAPENTTTRSMLKMRSLIVLREMGGDYHPQLFADLYEQFASIALSIGNWDRLAKVSWDYIGELARLRGKTAHLEEHHKAMENLKIASKNMNKSWIKRYLLKSIAGALLTRTRRMTFTGDAQELL